MKNKLVLLLFLFVVGTVAAQTRASRKAAKELEYQQKKQKEWDAYMVRVAAADAKKAKIAAEKEAKANDSIDIVNSEKPACEKMELPYFKKAITKTFEETEDIIEIHIKKNFRYPEFALEHNLEGRVAVEYLITKEGDVEIELIKGPKNGLILEEEAERIIKLLPKYIPVRCDEKAIRVRHVIPIIFKLN